MMKWGDRLKKVEQLAQSFQQKPLATHYKPRLWPCQPSSVWKLFPRQCMAISFAQGCKEAVHVFALEKENASLGQRIFLVTSYSELWHYYRTYPQSLMHCYEVILDGAVCKLYFDLEFCKPSNKGADGETMVSSFIQYVCDKLMEAFGLECSAVNVLNLDSSTDKKFSRHLIFNLQNAAFKDNIHMGRFINAILQPVLSAPESCPNVAMSSVAESSEIRRTHTVSEGTPAEPGETEESPQAKRRRQEETDLEFLRVKNKEDQDALFVDLGVYTKNRNFRLYKSSKVGKNAAFKLADDNTFTNKPEKGISEEESVFLASLVCNVSFTGQRILTSDVPEIKESKTSGPRCQQGSSATCAGSLRGSLSSPHPEVDNFVLTVIKKDGIHGSVRRWNYFAVEQLLVYDIAKYRWCQNVEKFHKSNNIMIVVDLKEEVWYQKCHDPDCKNFRSSSRPLPQEICVSHFIKLDEEDQAYLMDDAGNIEPSQAPKQTPDGPVCPEGADVWGDAQDDQDYLESLDAYEENNWDIPDHLLLKCMADFDPQ
ncbi:DNA-directed primase/polymerase protein [Spinachia spinachia]